MQLEVWIYVLVSVIAVSLVSLIGVVTLSISREFLRKIVLLLVSFAAGTLLGDVFLHIYPEMADETRLTTLQLSYLVLGGVMIFFVLEKIVHWRHCHVMEEDCVHPHPLAAMNLVGDSLHNFLDGALIAASYLVSIPVGVATTLAVLFHEIPQEIGDFGVLIHSGFTVKRALFMNFLSAIVSVFGAIIILALGTAAYFPSYVLLPVAAGGFIYIACADLFPELHKETATAKSILQLVFLSLGILVMALLRAFSQ